MKWSQVHIYILATKEIFVQNHFGVNMFCGLTLFVG